MGDECFDRIARRDTCRDLASAVAAGMLAASAAGGEASRRRNR